MPPDVLCIFKRVLQSQSTDKRTRHANAVQSICQINAKLGATPLITQHSNDVKHLLRTNTRFERIFIDGRSFCLSSANRAFLRDQRNVADYGWYHEFVWAPRRVGTSAKKLLSRTDLEKSRNLLGS